MVSDTDFRSLEAALAAVPHGGVLEVRAPHERPTAFVVDRAVSIRFVERGSIKITSSSEAAIALAAPGIRLENPVLRGTGGDVSDAGDGIRAIGTREVPLAGLQILGPRVSDFGRHGILLEHVHDFLIADIDIRRCGYSGVMLLAAVNGSVSRGLVKDILQPEGYVNSYGVAVTRRTTQPISGSGARSRDVRVEGLTIDGVRRWEALDTHAGENITFRDNTVYNSHVGIAIVGSKGESGEDIVYAPLNCRAIDNRLLSGVEDGTAGRGIVFAGAAGKVGEPNELATGRIVGNVVQAFGAQATPSGAGIQVYGTVGISVLDNLVIEPGSVGIDFHHDNYGAKAAGNTIIDVWTDQSPLCAAVTLRSEHNKVTISGTTIVRMAKTARKVNDRGLSIAVASTNVVLDGGGNDWAGAASHPTVGDATTTELRGFAKKTGFYGALPVPQARAIPSPAPEPAALKDAVDAIREALANIGLTG